MISCRKKSVAYFRHEISVLAMRKYFQCAGLRLAETRKRKDFWHSKDCYILTENGHNNEWWGKIALFCLIWGLETLAAPIKKSSM